MEKFVYLDFCYSIIPQRFECNLAYILEYDMNYFISRILIPRHAHVCIFDFKYEYFIFIC